MTHTLANGVRICTVDADERLTNFALSDIYKDGRIWLNGESRNPIMLDFAIGNKPLPPGNWMLLGRFEEITEDAWSGIVHSDVHYSNGTPTIVYKDYKWPLEVNRLLTATASARSLIHGNPVVLIEKK